jgi:hypothetical protein
VRLSYRRRLPTIGSSVVDEKFALVSKQLRGFDVAMVETGYRHTELYWTAMAETGVRRVSGGQNSHGH